MPPRYEITKSVPLIVTVAPSVSPLNVPLIASLPSLLMSSMSWPPDDAMLPVVAKVAPPRATVPVTLS